MGKLFSFYNCKARCLIFPFSEQGYFLPNNGPNHTTQLCPGQHHGALLTTSKRPGSSCTPGNELGKPSPGYPATCCHLLLPCPLQGSSSSVVRGRFARLGEFVTSLSLVRFSSTTMDCLGLPLHTSTGWPMSCCCCCCFTDWIVPALPALS